MGVVRNRTSECNAWFRKETQLWVADAGDTRKSEVVKVWPREAAQTQIISSKQVHSPCYKSPFNQGEIKKKPQFGTIEIAFQIIKNFIYQEHQ